MGHGVAATLLQGQAGLSAVQGLSFKLRKNKKIWVAINAMAAEPDGLNGRSGYVCPRK
jgi:hypothetical protein